MASKSDDVPAPALAGEPRGEFGRALDQQLPLKEQRLIFRRWRHTRPFWAGVLVILAGMIIVAYPLGPWPAMMALGSAALTGVAIGLILIIGGLFFWFAPHQRMFISIVLMICSVLSLVASNLGGFFLGMILGMVGSSMAFGWKPYSERKPPPPASLLPGGRPSPIRRDEGGTSSGKVAALMIIGALLAATTTLGMTEGSAQASFGTQAGFPTQGRPHGRPPLPSVGCGTTEVVASDLKATNVTILGTETIRDGCGRSIEVVDLLIEDAVLKNYQLLSPGQTFKIVTDLQISDIELPTPKLRANVNIAKLITDQLGLPQLPIGIPIGPVPIDPPLVRTLESLNLLPLTIRGLEASPASWQQPIIRGGDVKLINTGMRIIGPLTPVG